MIAFAALALGSQLVLPVAEKVPTFNVVPTCRAVSEVFAAGRNTDSCLDEEHNARNDLVSHWSRYTAAEKSRCIDLSNAGGPPSYVELFTCLEIAYEVRHLDKPNAESATTGVAPRKTPAIETPGEER